MSIEAPVSISKISHIIKNANTSTTSLNETLVRTLLNKSSGAISLGDAIGKPEPGSLVYDVPGDYSWVVPPYQNLTVILEGPGGGGGGGSTAFVYWFPGVPGTTGTNTTFGAITATAGKGGTVAPAGYGAANVESYGIGIGGDTNTDGGGAAGGAGGAGNGAGDSQDGAPGGLSQKTWRFSTTADYPEWGSTISLSVGERGTGGAYGSGGGGWGANGTNGKITISWS